MAGTVTLAGWQFVLLLVLATYAVWRLLLFPVLQRLIYRRSQITEKILEEELQFGLPAYAMANRQLWVDRVISDPEVNAAIEHAAESLGSKKSAQREARKFASEIVPSFNALLYFRIGYWIARKWLRLFYWIQVVFSSKCI